MNKMKLRTQALGRRAIRLLFRTPSPLLRLVAGSPRLSDEGVPLDLQTQALIGLQARARLSLAPPPDGATPTLLRAMMDRLGQVGGPEPARLAGTEDQLLSLSGRDLRLRWYIPEAGATHLLPLILWCHGGGYAMGSIEAYDLLCRFFAHRAGCIVASVDYRLAPEHPFPSAVDDCLETFLWLAENGASLGADPERIAVCGDSAGGTLATVTCQLARPPGPRPCFQLLIYPSTDLTRSHPSHGTFARGLVLTDELIRYFTRVYVPEREQDLRDPRLSPLFAEDLSYLPPALLYTAGFDALRDEGRAYARRLKQAGVEVVHRELADQIHGFLNMSGVLSRAGQALEEMAAALREALHGAPSRAEGGALE